MSYTWENLVGFENQWFREHRIWDLSLERDAEEEAEYQALLKQQAEPPADLPPQLLFVHQVRTHSPPIYADGIITESLLLLEIADIDIL